MHQDMDAAILVMPAYRTYKPSMFTVVFYVTMMNAATNTVGATPIGKFHLSQTQFLL